MQLAVRQMQTEVAISRVDSKIVKSFIHLKKTVKNLPVSPLIPE